MKLRNINSHALDNALDLYHEAAAIGVIDDKYMWKLHCSGVQSSKDDRYIYDPEYSTPWSRLGSREHSFELNLKAMLVDTVLFFIVRGVHRQSRLVCSGYFILDADDDLSLVICILGTLSYRDIRRQPASTVVCEDNVERTVVIGTPTATLVIRKDNDMAAELDSYELITATLFGSEGFI